MDNDQRLLAVITGGVLNRGEVVTVFDLSGTGSGIKTMDGAAR